MGHSHLKDLVCNTPVEEQEQPQGCGERAQGRLLLLSVLSITAMYQ